MAAASWAGAILVSLAAIAAVGVAASPHVFGRLHPAPAAPYAAAASVPQAAADQLAAVLDQRISCTLHHAGLMQLLKALQCALPAGLHMRVACPSFPTDPWAGVSAHIDGQPVRAVLDRYVTVWHAAWSERAGAVVIAFPMPPADHDRALSLLRDAAAAPALRAQAIARLADSGDPDDLRALILALPQADSAARHQLLEPIGEASNLVGDYEPIGTGPELVALPVTLRGDPAVGAALMAVGHSLDLMDEVSWCDAAGALRLRAGLDRMIHDLAPADTYMREWVATALITLDDPAGIDALLLAAAADRTGCFDNALAQCADPRATDALARAVALVQGDYKRMTSNENAAEIRRTQSAQDANDEQMRPQYLAQALGICAGAEPRRNQLLLAWLGDRGIPNNVRATLALSVLRLHPPGWRASVDAYLAESPSVYDNPDLAADTRTRAWLALALAGDRAAWLDLALRGDWWNLDQDWSALSLCAPANAVAAVQAQSDDADQDVALHADTALLCLSADPRPALAHWRAQIERHAAACRGDEQREYQLYEIIAGTASAAHDPLVIASLVPWLSCDDETLLKAAARAIFSSGERSARDQLFSMLAASNSSTLSLIQGLADARAATPPTTQERAALWRLVRESPSAAIRRAALSCLCTFPSSDTDQAMLLACMHGADPSMRLSAAQVFGAERPEAIAVFYELGASTVTSDIRQKAIAMLGKAGSAAALAAAEQIALASHDAKQRSQALIAVSGHIRAAAPERAAAVDDLLQILAHNGDPGIREFGCRSLIEALGIDGIPRARAIAAAVAALADACNDYGGDRTLDLNALVATRDPEVAEAMRARLQTIADPALRNEVAAGLRLMSGSPAQRVLAQGGGASATSGALAPAAPDF